MKTTKVNALSLEDLEKIYGGGPTAGDTCAGNGTNCESCSGTDDTDCTSEAASGGTTTDTYN